MGAVVRGPRPGDGAAPPFGERPCTVSRSGRAAGV